MPAAAPSPQSARSAAADALVRRHGARIAATARRYAASEHDAEDAYGRTLEIVLRKAPPLADEQLVAWARTVAKHEALSLRRARALPAGRGSDLLASACAPDVAHARAEARERLRSIAEAMRALKPQELRCLLLRAEGHSYRAICELTGWSYTKVDRCLKEGRARLRGLVAAAGDAA